jgi:DNA-binding response OmpR family regulator
MNCKKIIVVDDEPDLLRAVTLTLRKFGYEVVPAGSGTYALDLIMLAENAGEPMDLLITDLHLPGISGIELIEKVRRSGSRVAIGAITAFGNSRIKAGLEKIGCRFCLDKPFNGEELLKNVFVALGENDEVKSLQDQAW